MISVVLPVRNQADHIGRLLEEYIRAMEGLSEDFELIAVVNASTDASLSRCREKQDEDGRVQVAKSEQAGWGRAVRLGLASARGDVLCYTNSARTQPDDLAALVTVHRSHRDSVVKAKRVQRERLSRRMGSLSYNLLCRWLFGVAQSDINGTPKIFERRVYERVSLTDNGDLIDLEFMIECKRRAIPVLEIPIASTRRHGGRSGTSLRTARGLYIGALKLWLEQKNQHRRSASETPTREITR